MSRASVTVSSRRAPIDTELLKALAARYPWLARVVTAAIVTLLLIGRRPQSFFHPQLWGEDGPIFYGPELVHGAAQMLFVPYAGYLQFVSRLTSMLATHVPAAFAPTVYAIVSYAIAIWACSMFVESRFANIVRSRLLRAIVCIAFASVPPTFELIGTITNAHWYLALAALLLLIGSPLYGRENLTKNIWSAVALVMSGLSAPETVVFVPLAFRQQLLAREFAARAAPIAFLVAIATQVVELILDPLHQAPSAHYGFDQVVFSTIVAFIHRVIITAIVGQPASQLMSALGLQGVALLTGLVFVATVAVVVGEKSNGRTRVIVLFAVSFVLVAVAIEGRGMAPLYPSLATISYGGERYFFLPIVTFMLAIAAILDSRTKFAESTRATLFSALFLCGGAYNYRVADLPDQNWTSYAQQIDGWIVSARRQLPTAMLSVPINPPGWAVSLPAEHLMTAAVPRSHTQAGQPVPSRTYALDALAIDGQPEVTLANVPVLIGDNQNFTVRGWVIDPSTLEAPKRLTIFIDGRPAGMATRFTLRPDVAEVLGKPQAANSGFSIHVSTARLSARLHHASFALLTQNAQIVRLPTGIDLLVQRPR